VVRDRWLFLIACYVGRQTASNTQCSPDKLQFAMQYAAPV
jgi:hypothetical protein